MNFHIITSKDKMVGFEAARFTVTYVRMVWWLVTVLAVVSLKTYLTPASSIKYNSHEIAMEVFKNSAPPPNASEISFPTPK